MFTLTPPNALVHNIVIGRTWVDVAGDLTLNCPSTGCKCVLAFKPCGWFSYGRYEFEGFVYDKGECGRRARGITSRPGHCEHAALC